MGYRATRGDWRHDSAPAGTAPGRRGQHALLDYLTDCGIVSPRAFDVLRLMTSPNLVGCSTGRSAGLAPLRIRSTNFAPILYWSIRLGPYAMR